MKYEYLYIQYEWTNERTQTGYAHGYTSTQQRRQSEWDRNWNETRKVENMKTK